MSVSAEEIAASQALCRKLAKQSHSSFYPSFLLLSPEKRRAMEALYAFMRYTDDLSDDAALRGDRAAALAQWRAELRLALDEATASEDGSKHAAASSRREKFASDAPTDAAAGVGILPALVDAVRRFAIPTEHLFAVLDGVETDLQPIRFAQFDDLAAYCHRVASAVGLACLPIWGFHGDPTEPARHCGLAFQLTNVLRDLREDAERGRLYLPLDEMTQYGYAEADLLAGKADSRFHALMAFQMDRAERHFQAAVPLFDLLDRDGQRILGMMMNTYHAILLKIRRRPDEVLRRRVRLSLPRKLTLAARWFLLPPRRASLP